MGAPIDEWLALAYGRDQIQFQSYGGFKIKPYKREKSTRRLFSCTELERTKLNESYETSPIA
jgi:hypothetical protein